MPAGHWALSRYGDVKAAFHDPRFGFTGAPLSGLDLATLGHGAGQGGAKPGNAAADLSAALAAQGAKSIERLRGHWFGAADPPDHPRIRAVVKQALAPRMAAMRPRLEETLGRLLGEATAEGTAELGAKVVFPLGAITMAEIIGLPPQHRAYFGRWFVDTECLFGLQVRRETLVPCQEVIQYFSNLVAARRRRPQDDLISDLVAAADERHELTEEELVATCITVLFAGYHSVETFLVNSAALLLARPAELAGLGADPLARWNAVEELLRWVFRPTRRPRFAQTDIEVGPTRIRRGERVDLLLGEANFDPAEFTQPDLLDLARAHNAHLSFGSGPHYCLGAPLARLEAEVFIQALAAHPPRLAPAPDGQPRATRLGDPAALWVTF